MNSFLRLIVCIRDSAHQVWGSHVPALVIKTTAIFLMTSSAPPITSSHHLRISLNPTDDFKMVHMLKMLRTHLYFATLQAIVLRLTVYRSASIFPDNLR